ncbi:alanine racemase, partial [Candidatus Bipolaricaulota bacterium]|nr:alanine racemase [Candidatus Bipolaricaulota bacterium]
VSAIDGVRVGDDVILFGDEPSADEVARRSGTINYEVTCRVNKRVPRIYMNRSSS